MHCSLNFLSSVKSATRRLAACDNDFKAAVARSWPHGMREVSKIQLPVAFCLGELAAADSLKLKRQHPAATFAGEDTSKRAENKPASLGGRSGIGAEFVRGRALDKKISRAC